MFYPVRAFVIKDAQEEFEHSSVLFLISLTNNSDVPEFKSKGFWILLSGL
jgi:hypothetical protein